MLLSQRALSAFSALLLLSTVPAEAQQAAIPSKVAAPAAAAPQYTQPDDPWIYHGTDIPIDKQWLFGATPNGVRYAVRNNGVPPGQVSIRIRIDAGSLYEEDSEQGLAHLIEHLTFRQSKYLANGEAIPHFQRLGASLGNDTNAQTTPTQTVYQLDLPNATDATLEDSIRVFAGMIEEPALSPANVTAEVPIVLAERRERSGPEQRIADATRRVFFAGQRLSMRNPIGEMSTLQAATSASVKAFHHRWYRPENTTVVVVGDADPARLAGLVEQYFGSWQVAGTHTLAPDFGYPVAPRGANPANPVGETGVLVETGQPRGLTYAYLRPWHQVTDNIEYNRGLLIDSIAEAILNRRLEARARVGGSYLYAQVQQDKVSRSDDATYVAFAPLTKDWQTPLAEVRAVIADAIAEPPSQAEIDRELADFDVVFANTVEQSRIQAGSKLANDIVNAADIREAVASPETVLEVFRSMHDRFNPAEIHAHTKALFEGEVIRALYLTPEAGEATEAALRQAMLEPVVSDDHARTQVAAIKFSDLPPVGTPTQPLLREAVGIFNTGDVEQVEFANGVRALLWPTQNEPGRATVRVTFGAGRLGLTPDEGAYATLGQLALVSSGLGPIGQDQLELLTAGRKIGFTFGIEDGHFTFEGQTRAEDVPDQLYLFAEKLAAPRWDAAPFERAKASALLSYDSYAGSAEGVVNRDVDWLLHGRDPRFATPGPDALQQTSAAGFQKVWSRLLAQGPVEVDVFGDFDRETVVASLSRTFGALAPREPVSSIVPFASFPAANATPQVLTHHGEPDQAAAVISWPTSGGSAALPESRKVEMLAEIFSNRLLDALRERLGASYSPFVSSTWPLDTNGGGNLLALAQLPPAQVPAFFEEAGKIADDLAATGPTADELGRVTEPTRQLLQRAQTGHTFWLNQLQGGALDSNRIAQLPTIFSDYTQVTPEEIRALAARYLGSRGGYRVAIMPEAAAKSAGR
ncbi:MAG: insulinase family protein [Croceibacterium sp.]